MKATDGPYSVDKLMLKIASALVSDFRQLDSDPSSLDTFRSLLSPGCVREFRAFEFGKEKSSTSTDFKCRYQLESLFKRYRFENDLYSDSDLRDIAIKQFRDNQERLASLELIRDDYPMYIWAVLSRARRYCKKVLGKFESDEHASLCRFGSRATVGIPLRTASEAERYRVPISGSGDHIDWFRSEIMDRDPSVSRYILDQAKGVNPFVTVDSLTLTLVPKTFKSLRSIMPNTTLGSFYSDGLGSMIECRLKRHGYDIRTLQVTHGEVARSASISNKLVTMDQSLASDNITSWLVEQILPYDWFEALRLGRISKIAMPDGKIDELLSFCTMGIGFTFPLQTLIFLSLLHGIASHLGRRRVFISAYGDDLIYDRVLHPFVDTIFTRLGLLINRDKTFVDGPFRESCGSDFYAGVDVRPFQPRNERSSCTRKEYEATLYKYFNGLVRRWLPVEIPVTLSLLIDELSRCSRGILRVPPDFPDIAGIRVEKRNDFGLSEALCVPLKVTKHGKWIFFYLRASARYREETRHAPFLWSALQNLRNRFDYADYASPPRVDSDTLRSIERVTGLPQSPESFRLLSIASKHGSVRRKRVATCIPCKGGAVLIQRQRGESGHWSP